MSMCTRRVYVETPEHVAIKPQERFASHSPSADQYVTNAGSVTTHFDANKRRIYTKTVVLLGSTDSVVV